MHLDRNRAGEPQRLGFVNSHGGGGDSVVRKDLLQNPIGHAFDQGEPGLLDQRDDSPLDAFVVDGVLESIALDRVGGVEFDSDVDDYVLRLVPLPVIDTDDRAQAQIGDMDSGPIDRYRAFASHRALLAGCPSCGKYIENYQSLHRTGKHAGKGAMMTIRMNRRRFVHTAAVGGAAIAFGHDMLAAAPTAQPLAQRVPMPPLPYVANALEPHISQRTVHLHYNGHHKMYFNTLAGYLRGREQFRELTLDRIVQDTSRGILMDESIHVVAVLLWNHNIYWQSMKPRGGAVPSQGPFVQAVKQSFGSFDALKTEIARKAETLGIGWVWVVKAGEGVKVKWTDYQDSPLIKGEKPLLALDVWEHAYYLDYRNERTKYVRNWLDHLVNWDFAAANFAHDPQAAAE
ncbi:MAG: hypothetical protein GF331_02365 [Chitinivibrionales bacterium]|nr:hypothetical protein [Chitinivibrionales bacterium]